MSKDKPSIYNILPRISLTILVVVSLFSLVSPVLAMPSQDWIAECERRNLLYGCDCDCRADGAQMCSQNNIDCNVSRLDEETSHLGLAPFSTFNNGVIVVKNGTLDVGHTVFNILYLVFIVGGIAAVAFVLYGIFVWGTAGPDDDRVTQGQSIIKNAVIGFLIMMAGMLIMTVLSGVLGFSDADNLDDINDSIDNTNVNDKEDGDTIRDLLNL
jgi:hypothetical protein